MASIQRDDRRQWSCGVGNQRIRVRDLRPLALLPHFADEANALARQGPDQPLFGSAVADRGPHRVDARAQSRFGNDATGPDLFDQFIPADDVVAVTDQIKQEIEGLRFHGNDRCALAQFAQVRIEHVIVENINQMQYPPAVSGAGYRASFAKRK